MSTTIKFKSEGEGEGEDPIIFLFANENLFVIKRKLVGRPCLIQFTTNKILVPEMWV